MGTWKSLTTTLHILIEHWTGSAWSVVSAPDPGDNDQLLSVAALAANDAWAVGERHDPALGSQPLIMHWNGTSWTELAGSATGSGFNQPFTNNGVPQIAVGPTAGASYVPGGNAPIVNLQPVDTTVVGGNTAMLSVSVAPKRPPTPQAATSPTL